MVEKTTKDVTTIQVSKETRDTLLALGRMGESYDAVIRRLLDGKNPEEIEEPRGDG